MPLLADRFLHTHNATVDLATGRPVSLRLLQPCAPADEKAWAARCTQLSNVWHEDLPTLVDFGLHAGGRFEAYDGSTASTWTPVAAEAVSAFLGELDPPQDSASERETSAYVGGPHLGIRLVGRAALVHFQELLDESRTGRPLSIACVGERGSGRSTFIRLAAASARLRGYVPVAVRVLERYPALLTTIAARHVLLISDNEDPSGRVPPAWLRLCASVPGAHVRLEASGPTPAGADVVITLEACSSDSLASAVHWHPRASFAMRQVKRRAVESGGNPGRFLAALGWRGERRHAMKVAETRAAYRSTVDSSARDAELDHPWADLIEDATRAARSGKRASAERSFRQISGAARRRHLALAAAVADTHLGWMRLARGHTEEARALFARALEDDIPSARLVDAALGLAEAHMAAGTLEQAEATLRGARATDLARPTLALARCLRIQGRFEEAADLLAPVAASADSVLRARGQTVLARLAFAQDDLPAAARLASDALVVGRQVQDLVLCCSAHEVLAGVHARVMDTIAAAAHADQSVRAARQAGLPVRELVARATRLECLHACGQGVERRAVDRLLAVSARMPPLVRARLWRCAARTVACPRERAAWCERIEEFVRATGARGWLARARDSAGRLIPSDVESLLQLQAGTQDLRRVAVLTLEWLRERLSARSAHLVDEHGTVVARAGPADPIGAARRVLLTRVAQPPWLASDGLEAAVPLRAATHVRGVLGCRWSIDRTPARDTVPLLSVAAAILTPTLVDLSERTDAALCPVRDGIVGRSAAILRLRDAVTRAGPAPFSVLVEGESGVGKELVARAIHAASPRHARPMVAVNCAALSDELFEAELFGHARGAFTGAHADRPGLFEQADGSTLFLDEISELSARGQAKLLRAIQEGEVRRVGENVVRRVDVRVVAASNRRLQGEVAQGRFRQDLLFRLAVIGILVPALRDRVEDIPLLAAHHWQGAAERTGSRAALSAGAVAALARYPWPGNVRELQNVMAALAVQVPRGRVEEEHVAALTGAIHREPASGTLDEARTAFEREFVATVLARCGGRQSRAARELGLSRQGLAKLLKRLAIG